MPEIILINTVHEEIGLCNYMALYKIICKENPEVIFEELTKEAFDACYNFQSIITLETLAIKMYLLNHSIKHLPMVNNNIGLEFNNKMNFLTQNKSYCRLIDKLNEYEYNYGFQFLNSDLCIELFDEIKELERVIFVEHKDENLNNLNRLSDMAIDKYENGIIENIYKYSEENVFNKAIMLIGAAHRKSIIHKIQEYQTNHKVKINWTFYGNNVV